MKYANFLDSKDILVGAGALVGVGCHKVVVAGSDIREGECEWRGMR